MNLLLFCDGVSIPQVSICCKCFLTMMMLTKMSMGCRFFSAFGSPYLSHLSLQLSLPAAYSRCSKSALYCSRRLSVDTVGTVGSNSIGCTCGYQQQQRLTSGGNGGSGGGGGDGRKAGGGGGDVARSTNLSHPLDSPQFLTCPPCPPHVTPYQLSPPLATHCHL